MTFAGLINLAKTNPNAKVRLLFHNEANNTGRMECSAEYAANPNASGRYFPPNEETAADLGWGAPWWYQHEIYKIIRLDEAGHPYK